MVDPLIFIYQVNIYLILLRYILDIFSRLRSPSKVSSFSYPNNQAVNFDPLFSLEPIFEKNEIFYL